MTNAVPIRAFKSAWFSKAAAKAGISDEALMTAIQQVIQGQADDLGGGVFKKRLNQNRHRSIVLAKGGRYWVYAYLFAKKDRANIEPEELSAFRKLAEAYGRMTDLELASALREGDLLELSDEKQT
jgi:hypothetical protein